MYSAVVECKRKCMDRVYPRPPLRRHSMGSASSPTQCPLGNHFTDKWKPSYLSGSSLDLSFSNYLYIPVFLSLLHWRKTLVSCPESTLALLPYGFSSVMGYSPCARNKVLVIQKWKTWALPWEAHSELGETDEQTCIQHVPQHSEVHVELPEPKRTKNTAGNTKRFLVLPSDYIQKTKPPRNEDLPSSVHSLEHCLRKHQICQCHEALVTSICGHKWTP